MTLLTCPAHVRAWLLAHPDASARRAAAALGLAPSTVRAYRSVLIRRGELAPRYCRIDWEAAEIAYQDGLITRDVARRLRVAPVSLLSGLRNRGLRVEDMRAGQVFAGVELARLCGVTLKRYSTHWLPALIAAGLRARVTIRPGRGTCKRRQWRITAEALMAFLATEAGQALIDPARITDPDWRAYAEDVRRGLYGPLRVVDVPRERAAPPTRLCLDCGASVSRTSLRCKRCAAYERERSRSHAAD